MSNFSIADVQIPNVANLINILRNFRHSGFQNNSYPLVQPKHSENICKNESVKATSKAVIDAIFSCQTNAWSYWEWNNYIVHFSWIHYTEKKNEVCACTHLKYIANVVSSKRKCRNIFSHFATPFVSPLCQEGMTVQMHQSFSFFFFCISLAMKWLTSAKN